VSFASSGLKMEAGTKKVRRGKREEVKNKTRKERKTKR
jgi:hypothetical protein